MDKIDNGTVSQTSDFIDSGHIVEQNEPEQSASHTFRISKDFIVIDDTMLPGTLLFNLPLTALLDPAATALSKNYEYFSFKEIIVDMQATSPLGTASGGFQAAWVTDPVNANIGTADAPEKAAALLKIIRQQDSVLIRPRTTQMMKIPTVGKRFTITGPDVRLSSFGNIVAVLRAAPGLGDTASFAVTVEGVIMFHRTTVGQGATFGSTAGVIEAVKIGNIISENEVEIIITTRGEPKFYKGMLLLNKRENVTFLGKQRGARRKWMQNFQELEVLCVGEEDGNTIYKSSIRTNNSAELDMVNCTSFSTHYNATYVAVSE